MAIAAFSTTVAASRTAAEVQTMLAYRSEVTGVAFSFAERSTKGVPGRVSFSVDTEFGSRSFLLPVRTDGVLAALKRDPNVAQRYKNLEQAERVAWRIARDWLRAELALVDAGLTTIPEVFMPYMLTAPGKTTYDVYVENQQKELT
jgi:hypothetical protein